PPIEEVRERLRDRLGAVWSSVWVKARNKKPRPRKAKAKQSGAHTSVHKLLQQAKQARQRNEKDSPSVRQ
ncbi:MAG TPA: hypothetical protein VFG68_20130, partial [Fimbriiglobus sp.]|nr:hypothetical protein [Fimbriiglobus sp.]